MVRTLLALIFCLTLPLGLRADNSCFSLPTDNVDIYHAGRESNYFVGTAGKTWTSGMFGCVRSEGNQVHEGIDIHAMRHDKKGEPLDPIKSTADGTVVYINKKAALSNYGKYLIIKHRIEGIEIYSLYAHLSEVDSQISVGKSVRRGDVVAVMGRTSNTKQSITRDRAHLHFELNLMVNDRFVQWHNLHCPGQRNDHGLWNGQNLVSLDPYKIFLKQAEQGARFNLTQFIRNETEMFRVLVPEPRFSWLQRYPMFIRKNPSLGSDAIGGFEIAFNFNGLPIELTPRSIKETRGIKKPTLLSVNAAENARNHGRHYLKQSGQTWHLTDKGMKWVDLVTY